MNSNEWPLVLFTMLTQISLGLLLSGLLLALSLKNIEFPAAADLKKLLVSVALGSMGIALLISFFHLTMPVHAIYAMSNTATSWLSREILLASLYFFILLGCLSALQYNIPHRDLSDYLYLAALLTGLVLIWSMSRLYMIPTVPVWNSPATMVAFFNTAVLSGGALTLLLLTLMVGRGSAFAELQRMHTVLFALIAAGVFIYLLNSLLLQPGLTTVTGSFNPALIPVWIRGGQVVFLLAGFSLLTYWYAWAQPSKTDYTNILIYSGVVCIVVAELLGRYLFYASYYRVGV